MFKCIILTIGLFFLFTLLFGVRTIYFIIRLIFGGGRKRPTRSQQQSEKPASQDDRIITYKKKEFEISNAEDVEFEEIKDDENNM